MITTSVVFDHRARTKKGNEGPVEIRISVDRKSYYIQTGVMVLHDEFVGGTVVDREDSDEFNERIRILCKKVNAVINEYLAKDMPLDILKLDAGFFRGSEDNPRTRIVVSEALALAKSLNMKTVAEGVEDKSTVDFLAQEGCDMIQGYYFAKPMPQAEYENTVIPVPGQQVQAPAAEPAPAEPEE